MYFGFSKAQMQKHQYSTLSAHNTTILWCEVIIVFLLFKRFFPVIHHPHSGIYCSIVLQLYKQMWFAGVFFSNRSNFKHHESLCNSLNTGDWDRGFLCLPAVCVFLIISMTDHNSFFICNRY